MVSLGGRWPNGLALDGSRNRLFWLDAKSNKLYGLVGCFYT